MPGYLIGWDACPTVETFEKKGRDIAKNWRESRARSADEQQFTSFLRDALGPILSFSSFCSFFTSRADAEAWIKIQLDPNNWLLLPQFAIAVLTDTSLSGELDLDKLAQERLEEIAGWPETLGGTQTDLVEAASIEISGQTAPICCFEPNSNFDNLEAEAKKSPQFHPCSPALSLRVLILRGILNRVYAIRQMYGPVSSEGIALFFGSYWAHWSITYDSAALAASARARDLGMDGTACLAAGWQVRSFLNYCACELLGRTLTRSEIRQSGLLIALEAAHLIVESKSGFPTVPSASSNRGPHRDFKTAFEVAQIVKPHGASWREKLTEICNSLDAANIRRPKTWEQEPWSDCLVSDRGKVVKAITHHLKNAKLHGVLTDSPQ